MYAPPRAEDIFSLFQTIDALALWEADYVIPLLATIVPSSIALGIAAHAGWRAKQESEKHTKIASAQLILRLKKPWHEPKFKAFLQKMQNKSPDLNKLEVEEFLNQMEDIAAFWKDGVLTDEHVKEMFGANLKGILENKFVRKELERWNKQKPDYTFVNLMKLLEKSESWKL